MLSHKQSCTRTLVSALLVSATLLAGAAHGQVEAAGPSASKKWSRSGNSNPAKGNIFGLFYPDHPIIFVNDGDEKMRLTSEGFLGIGLRNPTARLHLSGAENDGKTATLNITSERSPQTMLLDGNEIVLDLKTMVWADSKVALDIAGIKGGVESAVTESTKNIVLSSCNFDSVHIRKTRQRTKVLTDASKRFEQNLTPELTMLGIARAADLINELTSIVPEEISFRSLYLDESGGFTIHGYAQSSSSVNDFQVNLVKSSFFQDVNRQFSTKRRIFNMDVTDFKITSTLNIGEKK